MEPIPSFANNITIATHCRLLLNSYLQVTGKPLGDVGWIDLNNNELCRAFWNSEAIIASHGTEDDPVFNYGNRRALELWETNWHTLTTMPSRLTAEPIRQKERTEMLARVSEKGFIDSYAGVRITTTGKRFRIHGATVWALRRENGTKYGQAVVFTDWSVL